MNFNKINKHPKDDRIKFTESNHSYCINGSMDFISVTTLIDKFREKFDADEAIMKMRNSSKPMKEEYQGKTDEQIKQKWEGGGNEASEKGKKLHKDIEQFYEGKPIKEQTTDRKQFLSFVQEHPEFKPYRTEYVIYDETFKIAGTIDALYKVEEEFVIADWKSGKEIKKENKFKNFFKPVSHLPDSNFWHHSLQQNFYKYILENNYNIKVDRMFLVWLHPNNISYELIEVPDLQKEVKDMIMHEIGSRLK